MVAEGQLRTPDSGKLGIDIPPEITAFVADT